MCKIKLFDITEVCTMLGTTSRTLRFYEEQGLITSIVIPPSARRKYNEEQLGQIKKILSLRAIGLSVKSIKELVINKSSLKEVVLTNRAEMLRLIVEKQKQINLLEEVLQVIGQDKICENHVASQIDCNDEQFSIADICTDAILRDDYERCYMYFCEDLKITLPASALKHSVELTVNSLGKFLERGNQFRDDKLPNIVIHQLKYERMTVQLKYVFHGTLICGIWIDYV